ncbi:MAG: nucleoside 2-deoxyribosyltransferase [Variovorax sp.]
MNRRPRIYLAGPDVFLPDCAQVFAGLKAACDRLGLIGVEPSDGELDSGFEGGDDARAQRIYDGNIRLLREADGVVANLMAFRGHEPDSGTVFEAGFAVALGKPVVAYGVAQGSYAERVSRAIACTRDAAGVLRETASGLMVEGLGQRLNLMLTRSIGIEDSAQAALARIAALLDTARTRENLD